MEIVEHMHQPIDDQHQKMVGEQVDSRSRAIEELQRHHTKYGDFYRPITEAFAPNDDMTVSVNIDDLDVRLPGTKNDLAGAVRILRRNGFSPSTRPKEGDTSWSTFWTHKDDSRARVWFAFSSVQCQRIQVGTEFREMPVYEVQCSESLEDYSEQSKEITDDDIPF